MVALKGSEYLVFMEYFQVRQAQVLVNFFVGKILMQPAILVDALRQGRILVCGQRKIGWPMPIQKA